jgi:hypothetical protein
MITTGSITARQLEAADRLEEIIDEIKELVDEAKDLTKLRIFDRIVSDRAECWISNILVSLDSDHDYIGGCMITLINTVNEIRGEDDVESEE